MVHITTFQKQSTTIIIYLYNINTDRNIMLITLHYYAHHMQIIITARKLGQGNSIRSVCLEFCPWGGAWVAGVICGGGCVAGGHAWWGDAWQGGMCGGGHAWQEVCMAGACGGGACMVGGVPGGGYTWQGWHAWLGGHAWQGACMAGGKCMADTTRYGQ